MTTTTHVHRLKHSDLLALLIRHFDLHEGLFVLSVDFQVAVGAIGPTPDDMLPGMMVGVAGIGVEAVDLPGPNTLDASECNPRKVRGRSPRKPKATEGTA